MAHNCLQKFFLGNILLPHLGKYLINISHKTFLLCNMAIFYHTACKIAMVIRGKNKNFCKFAISIFHFSQNIVTFALFNIVLVFDNILL